MPQLGGLQTMGITLSQFWRLEYQGPTMDRFWSGSSGLQTADFLCPHMAEGTERSNRNSHDTYKGANPIHESSTLTTSFNYNCLPKAPAPKNIITLGTRVLTYEYLDRSSCRRTWH